MAKWKVELDVDGIVELLQSEEVVADLWKRTQAIADSANKKAGALAGEGGIKEASYFPQVEEHHRAHGIAVGHVWSNTPGAIREFRDHVLSSSMDAGR